MSKQIYLTKASMPPFEEYINEIRDMWDSHWITSMGPKHNQFEKELRNFLEVENVSVFTNGHNALELTIQALDLTGEVITTPYTFISTTHSITRNGLEPVFCDINANDFTIDADKIESLITENTSAIIPVHTYGNICDVEKIESIAQKYNLKVIYDAAHCFGETYKNKSVASFGDASIYSFHASKVFNTIEGGCVSTNNNKLHGKLEKLRNFGFSDGLSEYIGTNAKMNEFSAAMGICNLRHINKSILKRKKLTEYYNSSLKNIKSIKFITQVGDLKSNYSYYPIIINPTISRVNRDELFNYLNQNKIQALRNFYPITTDHPCYKNQEYKGTTPVSRSLSEQILLLPLNENLKFEDIEYICSKIKNFLK